MRDVFSGATKPTIFVANSFQIARTAFQVDDDDDDWNPVVPLAAEFPRLKFN